MKMVKKLTTASSGHLSVCLSDLYKETLTINNKAQLQTHKATLSYIMQGKHLWLRTFFFFFLDLLQKIRDIKFHFTHHRYAPFFFYVVSSNRLGWARGTPPCSWWTRKLGRRGETV